MCELYKFLFTARKTYVLTFYVVSFDKRLIYTSYSIGRFLKLSYNPKTTAFSVRLFHIEQIIWGFSNFIIKRN